MMLEEDDGSAWGWGLGPKVMYSGDVKNNVADGEGIALLTSSNYQGQFKEGRLHGKGELQWADCTTYAGEFTDGCLTGHGTYTWTDNSVYEGSVSLGIRHGVGKLTCGRSPAVYDGDWNHGARHGSGMLTLNGGAVYSGHFVNNVRQGFGSMKYRSGNVYTGQWAGGLRHGQGTMRWVETSEHYSGSWVNGQQEGQGEHVWLTCREPGSPFVCHNRYKGNWVQGKRNGHGVFYYATGASYAGDWQDNLKHGKGVYTSEALKKYDVEFVNDELVTALPLGVEHEETFVDVTQLSMACSAYSLAAEQKQLQLSINRHVFELRRMYSIYSRLADDNEFNIHVLKRFQFQKLLLDCGLRSRISLVELNAIINSCLVNASHREASFDAPLLFCEFLRAAVAISLKLYSHIYSSAIDTQAAMCFDQFVREDLKPHAGSFVGSLFVKEGLAVFVLKSLHKVNALFKKHASHQDHAIAARKLFFVADKIGLTPKHVSQRNLNLAIANYARPIGAPLDLEGSVDYATQFTLLEFLKVLTLACEFGVHEITSDTPAHYNSVEQIQEILVLTALKA